MLFLSIKLLSLIIFPADQFALSAAVAVCGLGRSINAHDMAMMTIAAKRVLVLRVLLKWLKFVVIIKDSE
jgi:hypothetical protein